MLSHKLILPTVGWRVIETPSQPTVASVIHLSSQGTQEVELRRVMVQAGLGESEAPSPKLPEREELGSSSGGAPA
jgi:hypothetical protein